MALEVRDAMGRLPGPVPSAVFDLAATAAAAAALAAGAGAPRRALPVPFLRRFAAASVLLMAAGLLLHAAFGVRTPLGAALGFA